MSKAFKDNLPFKGEVYVKNDVRVYIYEGYRAGYPNQCVVRVKGESDCTWVERDKITPLSNGINEKS